MKLIKGNILYPKTYRPDIGKPDAIIVPTNGFTRGDGHAVMGRGLAKQVAERWKSIPAQLGQAIRKKGNTVHHFYVGDFENLLTFPVKPITEQCNNMKSNIVRHMQDRFDPKDIVPGWACKARLNIIQKSARTLSTLVDETDWKKVIIPQVGCGFGELKWYDVRPVLDYYLDDRFYCIMYET